MQTTIKYNCKIIGNGFIKADIEGINLQNPSMNELTRATLTVTVNAPSSFTANIFQLPTESVKPPCASCHRLFEKTFNDGSNVFDIDITSLLQNTNSNHYVYVKISPLINITFETNAQLIVVADLTRPINTVKQELPTDAKISFDLGKIGTATVNLRDGNLSFSHADWMFGGGKSAFSLIHTYTGVSGDTDEIFTDIHTQAGKGWKTNFHQYLAGNDKNASYTDASGTEHFFAESNGKIYDTSGLGLFLKPLGNCKKLTDTNGNTMHFSPSGKLCCIESTVGNKLYIGYEDSGLETSNNINDVFYGNDSLKNTRVAYISNGNYTARFN